MKKIELEVLTTAFQIELEESQWVIIYLNDCGFHYTDIAWYNHDHGTILNYDDEKFEREGKIIGWSKLPTL